MSGDDHFIRPDNNELAHEYYCPHCSEMVPEANWPLHWMAHTPGQPRDVEEEALQWLALAYRDTNTDDAKYTRWNMAAAYAAGKAVGLSQPNPARPKASTLEALVKANDALRTLYGHDLGETLDMIVQEAFTATSVALADGPIAAAAQ